MADEILSNPYLSYYCVLVHNTGISSACFFNERFHITFSLFVRKQIAVYCEQTFSQMNFNKTKLRSFLTDGHLEDIRRIKRILF